MGTRGKPVAVTWELVGDIDDEPTTPDGIPAIARVLVDVEAPLRPFGSLPTPPKGTRAVSAELIEQQRGHVLPRLPSDEGDAL